MFKKIIFIFLALGFILKTAFAESKPTLVIPPFVEVKKAEINLADIASITTRETAFEKIVQDLKSIKIFSAPPAKGQISISGTKILSLIENAGIPLDSFAYSIPQVVVIQRAGRNISFKEVLDVATGYLTKFQNMDLQVKEISWENDQVVPLGETKIEVEKLGEPSAGKMPLKVYVTVDNQPAARFLATALVDDWREVPVLNKALERGMLINTDDIELVRVNRREQPYNIAETKDEILGKAVKTKINAGETLRRNLVDMPPVIPIGKKINMIYRLGALSATATGVAMDNGLNGEIIRIKNDNSRKIVKAKVISPVQVEVSAELSSGAVNMQGDNEK